MKKLTNWKIIRSGARLTVMGSDAETGVASKLTGIDVVEGGKPGQPAIATAKNGEQYALA